MQPQGAEAPSVAGNRAPVRHVSGKRSGVVPAFGVRKEITMNKEEIKGATQKGVGAVKEGAGKLVGNEKLQAEGMADKIAGKAKEAGGKAKEAVHKATR